MAHTAPPLLTELLKQVSRSFYRSMQLLPRAVRQQISLAYLLARTTDTIADTEIVPVAERLRALARLRERFLGKGRAPLNFSALISAPAPPAERALLERVEEALALLDQFNETDRRLIREVLAIISSGQELDLQRFGEANKQKLFALATPEELADYTYRVAGCAGEFWTKMCLEHLLDRRRIDSAYLLSTGAGFGQGLQLVNILRDLPRDLRQGRCYLPERELAQLGLRPADLLQPVNENRLRPLYNQYLAQAGQYLQAGWDYTNALPMRQVRLRLACALPIFIGIKTLAKLKNNPILPPDVRLKVSRAELRRMVFCMVIWYPCPKTWQRLPSRSFFQAG